MKTKYLLLFISLFLTSCNKNTISNTNYVYKYNDTFFKFHPNGYTLFEGNYEVNSLTTYTNLNTNEKQVNEVKFKGNLTFNKCNINEEVNFTGIINEGDVYESNTKISNDSIEDTIVKTYTAGTNNIANTTFDFHFKTKYNLKIAENSNALYDTTIFYYTGLCFLFKNDTTERIETYSFDTRFIFNKATYTCKTIENNIETYNTMTIKPIRSVKIKISENYDKTYESDSYSLKI